MTRQGVDGIAPRLALGIDLVSEADLNSGFAGVAPHAKGLEIVQVERQFGRVAHWLDVIDFQAADCVAQNAFESVAA
jgi:hypothetical protein